MFQILGAEEYSENKRRDWFFLYFLYTFWTTIMCKNQNFNEKFFRKQQKFLFLWFFLNEIISLEAIQSISRKTHSGSKRTLFLNICGYSEANVYEGLLNDSMESFMKFLILLKRDKMFKNIFLKFFFILGFCFKRVREIIYSNRIHEKINYREWSLNLKCYKICCVQNLCLLN